MYVSLAKIDQSQGIVGHWKLQGDCLDYSGKNNHGINHGVDLRTGQFDGQQQGTVHVLGLAPLFPIPVLVPALADDRTG